MNKIKGQADTNHPIRPKTAAAKIRCEGENFILNSEIITPEMIMAAAEVIADRLETNVQTAENLVRDVIGVWARDFALNVVS